MHNASKLAVLVTVSSLLLSVAASAKTMEQSYLESFVGSNPEMPVPLEVVVPTAKTRSDASVELTFVVNSDGTPMDIAVKSASDQSLVAPTKEAVSHWKFAPAKRNGEAVARKVVLPVRYVVSE
jgi:TonB family protein